MSILTRFRRREMRAKEYGEAQARMDTAREDSRRTTFQTDAAAFWSKFAADTAHARRSIDEARAALVLAEQLIGTAADQLGGTR